MDVDYFFNSNLKAEDVAAVSKYQETGDSEDKPEANSTKNG